MQEACYCDFDPPEWYDTRRIKAARKPHRCDECSAIIAQGQPYERTTGKWEGEFSTFCVCELCREFREWAEISFPCLCWCYGSLHEDIWNKVEDARYEVPGLYFEYGRRKVKINRARRLSHETKR
jgi:hypothetical protein